MTDPIVLLQILWTGAVTASSYVLLTVAFSLTQKVTGLWNFAQAGTMGIAFYTMFFVLNDLRLPHGRRAAAGGGTAPLPRRRDRGLGPRCAARAPLRQPDVLHLHADPGRIGDLHPYLLFGTEPQTLFTSIMSPVHIVGGIAISDWDLRAVCHRRDHAGGLCTSS